MHTRRLLKLAGPLSVFATFRQLSAMMDVIAVGHLSRHDLSAAVLGTSICGVFAMSILGGLSSAMETLCGQVLCIIAIILSSDLCSMLLFHLHPGLKGVRQCGSILAPTVLMPKLLNLRVKPQFE